MLSIVTGTFRLFAARWPELIAIYLAGWTVRFLLIQFAGFLANINPLLGMLVLPIAVLARLASYVAMFLVLRSAMPNFMTMSEARLAKAGKPPQRFAQVLSSSILAFFIVFATWNMMHDDIVAYADSSIAQFNPFEPGADETATALTAAPTVTTIVIVVVAFFSRYLIKKFSERLPLWTSYLAVYLEAVWVFIAVIAIQRMIGTVVEWLSTREVAVWALDLIEAAKEAFAPLRWILDIGAWLITQGGLLVVLPLAWLALAGIVYSNALALGRASTDEDTGVTAKARARFERVPVSLRKRIVSLTGDLIDRWRPIADSARLIWSAGIVAVALFLCSYAVLDTSSLWLIQGFYLLIGPHELAWWHAIDSQIGLVTEALIEPLRLCLIAATYDFCLGIMRNRKQHGVRRPSATLESK